MVEFVLRGRDASYKDQVAAGVSAALANDTNVDLTGMVYKVVACSQDPPAPPATTNLTSTGNLAGATATYTCGAGYRLNTLSDTLVSLCDHSTTVWTPIPANLSCIVDMRCVGPPPLPPANASYTWDRKNLEQFTQVNYTCMPSFRATEGTFQTSQCVNKNWTNISSTFQCEYYGCGSLPPQVPDNAILTWNTLMTQNTVATYTCMDGYLATGSSSSVKLSCTNKTWGDLPPKFGCISSAYAFRTQVIIDDIDYFLVITIPSLVGLLFFICCCLCCTRTDSPLYCICNPRRKDNGFP
nr:uncharacterized protein LOC123757945 [Procambarus clarkii]